MKNKFLNFKSLMLIITLAFTINFFNISANADSSIPDPSELLYVTDNANILSDETENYLVEQNEILYENTGAQIAILTIDAIPEGYDSETYSYAVLDHWGVGSSEKNNGVVILLVPGEGKFWIAQGAGLEKTLSSYVLNKIIDNDLANDFDNKNYDKAVTNTFNSIVKLINKNYSSTEDKANPKNDLNTSKKSATDSLIPQRSQLIWVTDNADVLPDSSVNHIIAKNEKFPKTSNAEISVLTIENLPEGYDIETYAYEVFDEWGMNSKEKNNGVLLLIVSSENKTFIATGSGLKNSLTTSPGYKSIEENLATSLSTYSNKYNINNVVSRLATKINTIDKNNSYNSSNSTNNSGNNGSDSDKSDTPYLGYLFIILSFILFFWYFSKHASKSSRKNTAREKNYDSNSSDHNYTNNYNHSPFSSKKEHGYKYNDNRHCDDDRCKQNKNSFWNNNRYTPPKKSFWGSSSTSSRSSNSSSSSTKNKPPKKSSFGGGKSSPPKKNSFGGGKSSFFGSSSSSKNSSSGSSSFGGGSSRGGGAGRK
ncbi:YgcG family protein [Clostridium sp.]|uniref:YgcG family protein n=1 Tax=Clostridium sp. TaxID=1506 RepID=UPI003464C1B2